MKATSGILGLFVVWLAVGPKIALADPPPASFNIDFSGDAAIWNPFEGFVACESFSGATICLELHNMACDGKGMCWGDAVFDLSGVLGGSMTGPAHAKAKCKVTDDPNKPVCKAKLKVETAGTITNGVSCPSEVDAKVNGPVDSAGFYDGGAKGKVCVACPGQRKICESVRGTFEYIVIPPIPLSLTVQVAPQSPKLAGTATDSLGFSYTATGKYNEKKDESKILLKGEAGTVSEGAKVGLKKLLITGSSVMGGIAKISVQGNKSAVELGP